MKKSLVKRSKKAVKRDNSRLDSIMADVVCPYFLDLTQYSIACQSMIKGAENYSKFKTKETTEEYLYKFCTDMDFMKKCPQHKLITCYYNTYFAKREAEKAEEKINQIKNRI